MEEELLAKLSYYNCSVGFFKNQKKDEMKNYFRSLKLENYNKPFFFLIKLRHHEAVYLLKGCHSFKFLHKYVLIQNHSGFFYLLKLAALQCCARL